MFPIQDPDSDPSFAPHPLPKFLEGQRWER